MTQNSPLDANIPVLTEVIEQRSGEPGALPIERAAVPVLDRGAQLEARAVDAWGDQDWDLLERRLLERILQQLQGRVDFVLEQRIRDTMADVLQLTLAGLTDQIRDGLQQTIEKIVTRAVTQELTHLQTLKK